MSDGAERIRAAVEAALIESTDEERVEVSILLMLQALGTALLAELRAPEPGAEERTAALRDIEASKAVNRTRLTKPTLEGLFREGWDAALRAARGGR